MVKGEGMVKEKGLIEMRQKCTSRGASRRGRSGSGGEMEVDAKRGEFVRHGRRQR